MDEKVTDKEEIAETASEYKDDNISVVVDRQPGCRTKLDIFVTPKATLAAYKKAIKSINKEVSLPGFRKGKAPEAMIVKNYSKYVDQEWKDILVQTAFKEAIALAKVYPFNEESIQKPKINQFSKEEGANITIEFESAPQVPDIDTKGIKLTQVKRKEVSEEEIVDSMDNLRLHHATWEVKDRPVKEGDFVDVNIEDMDHPERFICKDSRFEVSERKMGSWMYKLVIGKNVGDAVEGLSERSPDLDPETEFKPTNCKITIKSIQTAALPDVDDELAKKTGVSSVEELKERMVANLNNQADEEVKEKLREQVEEALLEKYPFDIPSSLRDKEMKDRLEKARSEMLDANKSEEEISKRLEELQHELSKQADRAFQLFFIARKVANENDISITQEEIVKELMMQLYSRGSNINPSMEPDEARNKAYFTLLSQKVKDYLIDHAEIK
ncbi:MAG: Trigger factor [Chlamydiae bacterium]|nr:Trigger factor [Chlamydiota bacterium]